MTTHSATKPTPHTSLMFSWRCKAWQWWSCRTQDHHSTLTECRSTARLKVSTQLYGAHEVRISGVADLTLAEAEAVAAALIASTRRVAAAEAER